MRKRLFEMECPHCKSRFVMVCDTYLIADSKSKEYRRLKDRTFFVHQCQSCFHMFNLSYPLLYWDQKKHFRLILSQTKEVEDFPEGDTVLCRSPEQFQFAFLALDAGLSLQVALNARKKAERVKGDACTLQEVDCVNKIIWFVCKDSVLGIDYHEFR